MKFINLFNIIQLSTNLCVASLLCQLCNVKIKSKICVSAFHHPSILSNKPPYSICQTFLPRTLSSKSHLFSLDPSTSSSTSMDEKEKKLKTEIPPCYFRFHDKGRWMKRILLEDLKEGQLLKGVKLNQDLLNGKTGPKVFFECGVGRIQKVKPTDRITADMSDDNDNDIDNNNSLSDQPQYKWQIVNGMCRLGSRYHPKASVIRKRVMKLKKQSQLSETDPSMFIDLYVSKIRLDNQQLEVSLSPPSPSSSSEDDNNEEKKRISASSLKPNDEVIGTVVEVRDYGVIVDVNANRNGLLHIQKVADLYGKYIDKQKGLEKVGLEQGAKIRLSVSSNEKQRLFLDFTQDVIDDSKKELEAKQLVKELLNENNESENISVDEYDDNNDDEDEDEDDNNDDEFDAAAWAEFAAAPDNVEDAYEDDYNYYEDEDEDRDIEDSLGLGSY